MKLKFIFTPKGCEGVLQNAHFFMNIVKIPHCTCTSHSYTKINLAFNPDFRGLFKCLHTSCGRHTPCSAFKTVPMELHSPPKVSAKERMRGSQQRAERCPPCLHPGREGLPHILCSVPLSAMGELKSLHCLIRLRSLTSSSLSPMQIWTSC